MPLFRCGFRKIRAYFLGRLVNFKLLPLDVFLNFNRVQPFLEYLLLKVFTLFLDLFLNMILSLLHNLLVHGDRVTRHWLAPLLLVL